MSPVAGSAVAETIADVTAGWLSTALDVEVRSITTEPIGTGQIGATHRLHLDGNPSLPPTLVAKLGGGDVAARQRVADGYRKEVGFYLHLAPTLDVRTPGCWYGAITEDGCDFTLLLDDQPGTVPGVQADGMFLAMARRSSAAIRDLRSLDLV